MKEMVFASHHIDAIVFDVIGTLVDEDSTWASVAERISAMADLRRNTGSAPSMLRAPVQNDRPDKIASTSQSTTCRA
jgi:phosphoglycolate phosphatase-like HAD superfamily hydrolase